MNYCKIYIYELGRYFLSKKYKRTSEYSKGRYESGLIQYSDRKDKYFENMLCEKISSFNPDSVLEIGCGNGRNLFFIQNTFKDVDLYGLEITKYGSDMAQDRCPNAKVFCQSAEELPLGDNSIDVIISVHALEQMKYIVEDVVSEMYRVSKKGIILLEPFYEKQNFFGRLHNSSLDFVRNIFMHVENNGFIVQEFKNADIPNGSPVNVTWLLIAKK